MAGNEVCTKCGQYYVNARDDMGNHVCEVVITEEELIAEVNRGVRMFDTMMEKIKRLNTMSDDLGPKPEYYTEAHWQSMIADLAEIRARQEKEEVREMNAREETIAYIKELEEREAECYKPQFGPDVFFQQGRPTQETKEREEMSYEENQKEEWHEANIEYSDGPCLERAAGPDAPKQGQINKEVAIMDERIKVLFEIDSELRKQLRSVSRNDVEMACKSPEEPGELAPLAQMLWNYNESLSSLADSLLNTLHALEL